MYRIGIDLGGTNIAAGIVNEKFEIVAKDSVPTVVTEGADRVALDIAALCKKITVENNIPMSEIESIGVATPGIANSRDGVVEYANNLPFRKFPISSIITRETGVKSVHIENDANAAAWGEAIAGAAKGTTNSVMITLGTGVGGGVVLGSKLLTGYTGAASEIGHMVIAENGEECTCGSRGCFEAYSSATALIRDTKRAMAAHPESLLHAVAAEHGGVDGRTAFLARERGDEAGTQVVEDYIEHLTCGLTNLVNIFFPEVLALSGGVANQGDALLLPLRERVRERSFGSRYAVSHTRIELCTLGYRAGVIGAAMLARE